MWLQRGKRGGQTLASPVASASAAKPQRCSEPADEEGVCNTGLRKATINIFINLTVKQTK